MGIRLENDGSLHPAQNVLFGGDGIGFYIAGVEQIRHIPADPFSASYSLPCYFNISSLVSTRLLRYDFLLLKVGIVAAARRVQFKFCDSFNRDSKRIIRPL